LLLLEAIKNKNTSFREIPGVSFQEDGKVIPRRLTPFISDLDRYPYPGRELLLNQYKYTSEDMGVIMTSRGCPYKCGFCSHAPKVRYRNLDNVIAEIRDVRDEYGTRQFAIKDDSFTVNRKRTMEFCRILINERLDINWDCTTRVNLIDDELLDITEEAGCNVIKVGIETGSERIMKEVNKGITLEQAKKAADLLNKHGIFWSAYFMMGLRQETEEDILKTYEFMKEINPFYAGLGVYESFRHTELFDLGVEMGLLYPEVEIDHFFRTRPKDYYFIDPRRRVVEIKPERFEELTDYMTKYFDKHNKAFSKMAKRGWIRKKSYFNDPGLLFGDLRKAANWVLNR